MGNIQEFDSAVVNDPAKVPQGRSDISPLATVESRSGNCPVCAYCAGVRKLQFDGPWRDKAYRKLGFRPKSPICSQCYHKLKTGRMVFEIDTTGVVLRSRIADLKRKAHFLAENGGSIDDLDVLLREADNCRGFLLVAENEFKLAASKAAAAAEKVSWIGSLINDAVEVIERKTKVTYAFCRKIANKANGRVSRRRSVFERAGFKCEKCGSSDFLSVDHIVPIRRGGIDEDSNLQCLCLKCNCSKGAR